MLGIKEIQEIIPHRHPFLLVDCVEELEPGVRAVGLAERAAVILKRRTSL